MDTLNIVNLSTSFLEIDYKYKVEEDNLAVGDENEIEINFSSIEISPQKHLRDGTLFQLTMQSRCDINSPAFDLSCRPCVILEFKLVTDERYQLEQYLDKHEQEIRSIFQSEVEEGLVQFFKLTPTQTNKNYGRNH